MKFTLEDLGPIEHRSRRLDGAAWIENGQLMIELNTHGNQSEDCGPIIGLQLDKGIARLIVFRDINSDAPTESLDLDGALESKRHEPCIVCGASLPADDIVWANKDGTLSTHTGSPYCVSCLPAQPEEKP
jgi:hypothetical protein